MKVLASRVFRTGLQKLLWDPVGRKHYVSIKNRTYASMVEIPHEKVAIWMERLAPPDPWEHYPEGQPLDPNEEPPERYRA